MAIMIKKMLKIGLLFSIFLLVTGISAYLALTYFIRNEDSVVVPELVGKEVIQVLEILSNMGLNTKVNGSEFSSQIPQNHVIYQDPEPGTIIKKGRDVRIVFSKGTQSVFLPAFVNLDLQAAESLLTENGLSQGSLTYIYNDEILKNSVIGQYPDQGMATQRGSSINLLVSLGKRPVEYLLSNFSGMSLDDAIIRIERNHMKVGEIRSAPSETQPLNTVTAQEPVAGSRILEGSPINLVINRKQGDTPTGAYTANQGVRLFRYHVEKGFLKKHIRVQMRCSGSMNDVYNDFANPGEDIWVMVPLETPATIFVYDDDTLVKTQFFD